MDASTSTSQSSFSSSRNNVNDHHQNLLDSSFENIAQHILANHLSDEYSLIGLGSGKAVSKIVNRLSGPIIKRCEFICTSLQIKIEAEKRG